MLFFQQKSYIWYEEVIHFSTERHRNLLKKHFKKFTHMMNNLGKNLGEYLRTFQPNFFYSKSKYLRNFTKIRDRGYSVHSVHSVRCKCARCTRCTLCTRCAHCAQSVIAAAMHISMSLSLCYIGVSVHAHVNTRVNLCVCVCAMYIYII